MKEKALHSLFAEMLAARARGDELEARRIHDLLLPHSAVGCPVCQGSA